MKLLLLLSWLAYVKVSGGFGEYHLASQNSGELQNHRIWSKIVNNTWVCGNSIGGVVDCTTTNPDFITIVRCYCIYYDFDYNTSIFGRCFTTCFSPTTKNYLKFERPYVQSASTFNKAVCNSSYETHRRGRFCGQCDENYGLAVYSYDFTVCIPCTSHSYKSWLKFFSIALIPLTVVYLIIVLLRINLASNRLHGALLVVQIVMSPLNLQLIEEWMNSKTILKPQRIVFKTIFGFFGIFNLDFLRDVYPKFCLSQNLSILQVTALDYIPALYPFFLIFITYILVKLYDKHIKLLVWAWKPFKFCLSGYYQKFNIKTSLVETFASFILLSSVKLASISFSLLAVTHVYDTSGKPWPVCYLYYDSTMEFFGKEHLPYGVLAVFLLAVFVIAPILLMLLYPSAIFHRALNACGCNSHVLRVLMDAFQGSYKTKPLDMRYFSAYYLLLRYAIILVMECVQSLFGVFLITLLVIFSIFITTLLQPHRNPVQNKLDILALNILAFSFASVTLMMSTYYLDIYWLESSNVAFALTQVIILAYFVGAFAWSLCGGKCGSFWLQVKLYISSLRHTDNSNFGTREVLDDRDIEEASILIDTSDYRKYY